MNDIFKDISGIAMAIVGVAILTVVLRPQSQTVQVLSTAGNVFSQSLGTAMGGGSSMMGGGFGNMGASGMTGYGMVP